MVYQMDSLLDTFLNHDQFKTVSSTIESYLSELSKLPKDKRIKRIQQIFEFNKVFVTDSVQGVAGVCTINSGVIEHNNQENDQKEAVDIKEPIVFKISVQIDRTIEHENLVLQKLNKIRSFCPNFVASYGMLSAFVTKDFFEHEDEKHKLKVTESTNLFYVKQNSIPANFLLTEYVSNITFKHICKYASKQLVTSVLFGVLCALQIAQNELQFTHYDLHYDNILMRKVENDAFFAYIINGEVVYFPTYGWYPVMIDMGSSYVEGIEERPTRTGIAHYHRGLQSTCFDSIGDIHHFLLNALSRLEKQENNPNFSRHFRMIAGRVMHMFRHNQIWRHKGWKQLPCNLHYLFNEIISSAAPVTCEFYSLFKYEIIECLTLGVKLTWKEMSENELENLYHFFYPSNSSSSSLKRSYIEMLVKNSIEDISYFVDILDSDPLTNSDVNIMYSLRSLVEHASLIPLSYEGTFEVPKNIISTFKVVVNAVYPTLSYKLDLQRAFRGASCVCIVLQHLLAVFNKENINTMNQGYSKTEVKTPLNIIKFLKQNTAMRLNFEGNFTLYIWDSDRKKSIKTTFEKIGATNVSRKNVDKKILEYSKSH